MKCELRLIGTGRRALPRAKATIAEGTRLPLRRIAQQTWTTRAPSGSRVLIESGGVLLQLG